MPQLKESLATRTRELANERAVISALRTQLSESEHRVFQLEREAERERQFRDAQTREIERHQRDVAAADDRARSAATAVANMERINANLLTAANNSDEECKVLQRRLVQQEQVHKNLQQEIFGLQAAHKNAGVMRDQLEQQLAASAASYARLHAEFEEVSVQVATARGEAAEAKKRAAELSRQLAAERAKSTAAA